MEYKFTKSNFSGSRYFCGYASIFNVMDSYNDIILNGAFKNSIKNNNIKLCWQHNYDKSIGKINIIKEDSIGLYIECELNNENVYSYIKNGIISGLSIGYNVRECFFDNKNRRILKDIDLKEISIVSFPANKHANITYCKSIDEKSILNNFNKIINILKI